jgi:hypothetical protein
MVRLVTLPFLVVLKLAPEREQLSGRFREAFEKIFGLVEDAGWSLQPPEEEGQGEGVMDSRCLLYLAWLQANVFFMIQELHGVFPMGMKTPAFA